MNTNRRTGGWVKTIFAKRELAKEVGGSLCILTNPLAASRDFPIALINVDVVLAIRCRTCHECIGHFPDADIISVPISNTISTPEILKEWGRKGLCSRSPWNSYRCNCDWRSTDCKLSSKLNRSLLSSFNPSAFRYPPEFLRSISGDLFYRELTNFVLNPLAH